MDDTINKLVPKLNVGDDIEVFKSNMRIIMDAMGMSVQEFSEYIDIPLDTFRNFLYRGQGECRFYQVVKVAHRLGISVEELTGATTLTEHERNIIGKLRVLPESVTFYSEYAINDLYNKEPPKKSVVLWTLDDNWHVKTSIGMYDVSHLGDNCFPVNLAIKVPNDLYMPHFSHYSTLLIGTDKPSLAVPMGVYHIGERIVCLKEESGELRSILDGGFRHKLDEAKYIGYIYKVEG